jgi:hypothetical protein
VKFEQEQLKRRQVEEECDLLATENMRLLGELHQYQKLHVPRQASSGCKEANAGGDDADGGSSSLSKEADCAVDWTTLLQEGDSLYANEEILRITNPCGGRLVTCMQFLPGTVNGLEDCFAIGGADNSLLVYTLGGEVVWKHSFTSPLLALDSASHADAGLACSFMDGGVAIVVSSSSFREK